MGLIHLGAIVLLTQCGVVTGLGLKEDNDADCETQVDQEYNELEIVEDVTQALPRLEWVILFEHWIFGLEWIIRIEPCLTYPNGRVLTHYREDQDNGCGD